MSDCDRQCFKIGGPWIAEDPTCPVHGIEAQREKKIVEDRIADLEARVAALEDRLEARVAALEERLSSDRKPTDRKKH